MQGQPNPPILTGVPASGMAYLDRPSAAGYFIFPDLSVRHEGQYRLAFSLFETTKEEKDYDLDPVDANLPTGVDWRMEIKTAPFDVYSAKKFPGLMESTPLSKEVADQGCRVRIRRDVRMRKREGKSGAHDRREEGYPRRRTVTPATEGPNVAAARARSISNSSEQRVPYAAEIPRRPSLVDAYHPAPPPPPPQPSYDAANRGHLSFGDPSHAHPYAAPRQHTHQPLAPISPSGPYTPSAQYVKSEPHSYPYAPHSRGGPPPPVSPALRHHESQDRRMNGVYMPPSPVYSSTSSHARHDSHHSYPPTPHSAHPAHHMQSAHPLARIEPQPSNSHTTLPPLKISQLLQQPPSPLPRIEPQTEPLPLRSPMLTGDKRKREHVFSEVPHALHNGQRQMEAHYGARSHVSLSDSELSSFIRADGSLEFVRFRV